MERITRDIEQAACEELNLTDVSIEARLLDKESKSGMFMVFFLKMLKINVILSICRKPSVSGSPAVKRIPRGVFTQFFYLADQVLMFSIVRMTDTTVF